MTEPIKSLDDLRREIDEIDTGLHDLIMRRARVVARIAAAKGRSDAASFVPGREARVLRRLMARHDGPFPRQALARIWREMISAFAAMQGPYAVAAYADGEDQTCWDLARDHFGSHGAMTQVASPRDVVTRVFAGEAAIGVVPVPVGEAADPWWRMLCGANAPRIVALLPFVTGSNARDGAAGAFAIARVSPDATGDDRALLVIESTEEVSLAGLHGLMERAGLTPRPVASHRDGSGAHLIEVADFAAPDDPRLQRLEENEAILRVNVIGAYASPIVLGAAGPEQPEPESAS